MKLLTTMMMMMTMMMLMTMMMIAVTMMMVLAPEPKEHLQPLVSDNLHVCPSAQLSPDECDDDDFDDHKHDDNDVEPSPTSFH